MTFEEIKDEVWQNLGKPSDLNPDTDADERIAGWVNRGYKKILFWKLPNGRLLRFRCTEGELFFQTSVKTGTAEDGSDSSITLQSGQVGANDDQYNGWVVEITGGTGSGQSRLVTDYNGNTRVASVSSEWTTTPDATSTYALYKRFMKFLESSSVGASENIILSPVSSVYAVTKITDLEDKADLQPADRTDNWPADLTEDAIPGKYLLLGDRLVFDTAYSTARWYRMEYIQIPTDLSEDSDTPQIPEPWHEAIVLWATWKGLMRAQESQEAYARKRDLFDLIETTATQEELAHERENAGIQIDFG